MVAIDSKGNRQASVFGPIPVTTSNGAGPDSWFVFTWRAGNEY